jgi:S-adenosylmethionine hydrolase
VLGRPLATADLVRLPGRRPTRAGSSLTGQIVHIDRFGNAVTNIPAALLAELGPAADLTIRVGGQRLAGLRLTYAAVAPGEALTVIGSAGLLEIAVRNGDAARRFGIRVGDSVQCRRSAEEPDPAG